MKFSPKKTRGANFDKVFKWPLLCAVAVMLAAMYPQFVMWEVRGKDWHGAYAQVNGDEWLYSAYIQALIDGRPRRNDPYTGRDDTPQTTQPESVFSIQFVPAYLIALPARLFGYSASTAFIALGIIIPFLFCLSIFWLIRNVISDERLAASASVFTICFGGTAGAVGVLSSWTYGNQYFFLPFMRRYEPAAMIPLFFVFCGFTWKSLRTEGRNAVLWALAAGMALDVLIFSYLYLWTTALAWLSCLLVLWVLFKPSNLKGVLTTFTIIFLLGALGLVPYGLLLSHRSNTFDNDQKLAATHAPDLLRMPELIGIAALLLILFCVVQKKMPWRKPQTVMALSFLIAPFIVFNQQILTGRSLQPFHYQMFIANYVVLVGVALLGPVILSTNRGLSTRSAVWIVAIAFWWGAIEAVIHTNVIARESGFTDSVAALGKRLRERSRAEALERPSNADARPLVLTFDYEISIILPTFAPQAVLWSPNFDFLYLQPGERRDRLYKYLYYTGMNAQHFEIALRKPMGTIAAVTFGHERVLPDQAVNASPISDQEILAKVADYQQFCSAFGYEMASTFALSYVITPNSGADLSNLDRWYSRDEGERIGEWILYKIKLRPESLHK